MLKQAVIDLEKSGISVEEAEDGGMFTVKDASTLFEDFKPWPALVIPYPDPFGDGYFGFKRDGKLHDFVRVRYYQPKDKVHGFRKKKSLRYTQPSGSGIYPYFPDVSMVYDGKDVTWRDIAASCEIPLIITEGEKKAMAGCLAGFPTIGLGGVYNFKNDGEFLPVLERFAWKNRPVYICYDSDAASNSAVQVAESRLATELSVERRASPRLIRLPENDDGKKMGLDDFLVEYGDDAIFDIVEGARPMRSIDKAIIQMNADVAWISREGMLLDLRTDTFLRKDNFKQGDDFSTVYIEVPTEKGKGTKKLQVASAWLTSPLARRYTDTIFLPGNEDRIVPLEEGGTAYNRFRPLEGIPGDVEPFFDLYDHVMSRTDEFDIDLIWKIFCYKVQNLDAQIDLGFAFLGGQGGGKSLLVKILNEMFAPYHKTASSDLINDKNNGYLEKCLNLVLHEAKASNLHNNIDKLKTMITERTQALIEKYRSSQQIQVYALFMYTSNEKSAGAFAHDDRRFIVVGCADAHPDKEAFYEPIGDWYKNNGPKKLLHWMQNYDLEGWKPPREAPMTREKRMAYFESLSPVQKIAHEMKQADDHLVARWISTSINWAAAIDAQESAYTAKLAHDIARDLAHIKIRPFYSSEELTMLFPAIAASLRMSARKNMSANQVMYELRNEGVEYLRNVDNLDGFEYRGEMKQYLIVSNQKRFREPITQKHFDKIMKDSLSYRQWVKVQAQKRKLKR